MKKISIKIVTAMVLCSILLSLLISGISISKTYSLINKQIKNNMISKAENNTKDVEIILSDAERGVYGLGIAVKAGIQAENLNKKDYLKNYIKNMDSTVKTFAQNSKHILGAYYYINPEITGEITYSWYTDNNLDGRFEKTKDNTSNISNFNVKNEDLDWYYNPIKSKKAVWSDIYHDKVLKKDIISFSQPIYVGDTLIGIVGMDINFDFIRKKINSMKFGETGYCFLLDENFNYLVHKTIETGKNLKNIDGGSYKNLVEKIESKNKGIERLKFRNDKKYLGYAKTSNGWIMFDSINDDEVFKEANNLRNSLILVGITAVVICIFIALAVGKYISKPIERLTGLIDVTTDLDLVNNSEYDSMLKFKDETGTMVRAIAKMRKVLRNIVCDLSGNSKEVFTYSKELMNSIGEASASIDEISKTVDQLAAGSVEQAESAQKGTNKLNIFAEKIEDVVASTKLMEQYSSETIMANQECIESINDLQNKFSENNNMIVEVGNNVDKLSNQSNQINDIVKTIGAIAEQTNLLALNAAIEAARAGEHGRGFSVVADEIRKLSEQTSNSTIEISKIVSDIDNGISLTKGTMDSAKVINNDTNEVLENTTMIFDKIDAILAKTVEQIEKVFENVQRIDTDKEEILSSIEEISSISQESAAATEEVSSSITAESSVFENVLKTSQELEKLARKLDSIVNKFNIR